MEFEVQQFHHQNDEYAGNGADDDCAGGIYRGTGRCDGHQAGQRRIQTHGHIGLSIFPPGKQHADKGGYSRGERGVAQNLCELDRIRGCSTVESVPAEPQDKATQRSKG